MAQFQHTQHNHKKSILLVATIFIYALLLIAPAQASQKQAKVLTFGVVPQQAASKLARLWTPILSYLSEQSGIKIRFRTAPTIPEFEKRLAEGKYDFAYMNPYHYTTFHENPGYEAFAKQSKKKIKGIIVVRNDNPITNVVDLKESTLAFPSPAAFAASVLPRAYLKQEDIKFEPKYVSSHDSVYRSVAAGLYPAGGGIVRTLKNIEPEIQGQLKILWTTQPFTPHAFAAHPGVDKKIVAALQKAMIDMSNEEKGSELLKTIRFNGIEIAENADWNDIRELNLHLLDNSNN